jgi:hypothetical protein
VLSRILLHNAPATITITTARSRNEREAHACRVENFIERDDEPALGVLALRILFLHITRKLVLLAF